MRLNKYISSTGLCSRRKADELIKEERVKVNGQLPTIGVTVNPEDVVEVDGEVLKLNDEFVYLALNKPPGITCTTERHVEGNIIDFVNYPERIFPIGRLDKDSEGLILLTNDGSIVNKILREENNHDKDYVVTVNKAINGTFIENMSQGVEIYNPAQNEYTTTNKSKLEKLSSKSFKITLSQGLNRQIRRMCTKFGYRVIKLKRIRVVNIELGDLALGEWRYLSEKELKELFTIIKK